MKSLDKGIVPNFFGHLVQVITDFVCRLNSVRSGRDLAESLSNP